MNSELFDLFLSLPQQGPGSDACTKRALSYFSKEVHLEKILDIGCGTGRQTACLLRNTNAQVTAIDIWPPFLEKVRDRARADGTEDRLITRKLRMEALDFPEGSFDLIWAEGSAYNLGFEKALKEWSRFLRENGSMALSEVCWLTDEPSQELKNFWDKEYPTWWEDLYDPLQAEIERRRTEGGRTEAMNQLIEQIQHEIEMCRQYEGDYGYVFFIVRL